MSSLEDIQSELASTKADYARIEAYLVRTGDKVKRLEREEGETMKKIQDERIKCPNCGELVSPNFGDNPHEMNAGGYPCGRYTCRAKPKH